MNIEKHILTTLSVSYIPTLEYFWNMAHCDVCILTDHLQYTKRSPVSISPPLTAGVDCLRIPVKHDGKKLPISMKRIDNSSDFFSRQLKTITHTYHNFPYGYYYLPPIKKIMDEPCELLSDHLYSWLSQLVSWLHLPVELVKAADYPDAGTDEKFIIRICRKLNADSYINSAETFSSHWLRRELIDLEIPTEVFPDFPLANIFQTHRHLSVLTFLMRFGPEAGFLIKQFK